jgi:hypothetical protein
MYDRSMTIMEHDYGIPSEDDLMRLVGAATPHFALQIRDRVVAFADSLPGGDERLPALRAEVARLERLAVSGQGGPHDRADLPPSSSLDLRGGRARS